MITFPLTYCQQIIPDFTPVSTHKIHKMEFLAYRHHDEMDGAKGKKSKSNGTKATGKTIHNLITTFLSIHCLGQKKKTECSDLLLFVPRK